MELFVYGPLANPDFLFMVTRSRPNIERAELVGFEEIKTSRGLRTLRPLAGSCVKGLLIREPSETVKKRIEGYFGPNYKRITAPICGEKRVREIETYMVRDRMELEEGIIDTPWLLRVLRSVQNRPQTP